MQWTFDAKDEVKRRQTKARLPSYLKYKVASLFRIHLKTKKSEKLLRELYKGKCWNFLPALHDSKFKSAQWSSLPLAYQNSPILKNETFRIFVSTKLKLNRAARLVNELPH